MKILLNIVIPAVVIVGLFVFYTWTAYDAGRVKGRSEGAKACLEAVRETAAEIRVEREKDGSDWMMQKDKNNYGEAYNVLRPQPIDDETAPPFLSEWATGPGNREYRIVGKDLK